MFSFMVTLLLKIVIITINGGDLRKIFYGHELNRVANVGFNSVKVQEGG